ncbi:MAG: ATP-binding cassette domain-containing protein [Flavobacteriales bacterium]|nr:ATP-binding cassette domain-containing protein [Flavobacteriales bacterium]MCB9194129.1 ATP-binding cassette domain-containing protein [Flavobacteriales bacterium]
MEHATESRTDIAVEQEEVVVRIRGLCKAFGSHEVLRGFDLDLLRGENLMVLGKSGSGKSVLIKCIIGLLRPDAGHIDVLGQDMLALRHDALDRMRMRIGFLFQSNALYDSMTVRQNLEFPMRRHWSVMDANERKARIMKALEDVGLAHTADLMPSELSGGMAKRVGLARTLIMRPEIVLYDEPTTGLDPITGREIVELILQLQRQYNTSSILISHDLNVAKLAANRVVVLHEGRAHAQGTYDELLRAKDPVVRRFFMAL